jgi:tetratricopeptide (TPR) repeat protein
MKKKELVVLLLIILVIPLVAQQVPLDARLRGGRIHFQGGRYEKALEQFDLGLRDFPTSAEARFWKAIVLEKLGRYVDAAANFDTTYKNAPEWLEKTVKDPIFQFSAWNAFLKAGQAMEQNGQYSDAVIFYRRTTVIDPKNPQGFLLLSSVYSALDSFVEVRKMADALIALNPNNQQANILLGMYFFKQADWDSSLIYYDKAIAAFTQDWDAVKNLISKELKLDTVQASLVAAKLIKYRNERKLETYISDSLKANSKYMTIAKLTDQLSIDEAELNICNLRSGISALQKVNSVVQDSLQKKYLNIAIDYFYKALHFNPNDFDARYNLGMTYYRAGSDIKAESTFQELVQLSFISLNTVSEKLSQNLIGLIIKDNLSIGYIEVKEPLLEEVEKELTNRVTFTTGYWYVYFWTFKKSDVLPTEADANKIYLCSLASVAVENLWLLLGATQVILKKYDDAITSFNTVIALNPQNFDAYQNLAVCYREKGDLKKSYEYYQEWDKLKKAPNK